MPGFGSGPFGSGPFGAYDWAREVLWNDIPEVDRRVDAAEADGALEQWQESIMPSFEELLNFARDAEQLRDPDSVRTKFQDIVSVTITGSAVQQAGRLVRVTVLDTDPSDPFVPLGRTSIGWILTDSAGASFTVNQVHKIENAIDIVGATFPVNGAATLRPPALIGYLGADYGITVDQHDPEAFQRSSVRNAWQWLAMKGVEKAYQIIGDIAGYEITVHGLWKLGTTIPASIPLAHLFEYPVGSGIYYTDLDPSMPLYDEVAADIVPTDVFCWEEEPISGDTYGEIIGSTMQGLGIVSTTSLGSGLWRIRVGGADLTPVASAGIGSPHWYVTLPTGDAGQFWLEGTPTDIGGGVWDIEVYAGTAPTFGVTLNIDYSCPIVQVCGMCRASSIRVEIVPAAILLDPDALMAGALERTVEKVLQVVPIHVRFVDIVHIIGPVAAAVGVTAQHLIADVATRRAVQVYAQVGYYYDLTEADVIDVDPQHLVAPTTTFTIP